MNFWIGQLVVTSLNSYKHGIFSSECPLKSLLVSEGCDRDQVELEAMVLDYPKFYDHEYCSLVVTFHSSSM